MTLILRNLGGGHSLDLDGGVGGGCGREKGGDHTASASAPDEARRRERSELARSSSKPSFPLYSSSKPSFPPCPWIASRHTLPHSSSLTGSSLHDLCTPRLHLPAPGTRPQQGLSDALGNQDPGMQGRFSLLSGSVFCILLRVLDLWTEREERTKWEERIWAKMEKEERRRRCCRLRLGGSKVSRDFGCVIGWFAWLVPRSVRS